MVQQRSIEETYQKKNLHEHILDRPDSYIGSTKLIKEDCYVVDSDNKIIKKQIEYNPGLLKIFDEVLVNAIDHTVRDQTAKTIKIEIKDNIISVKNDGAGIPVVLHAEYGIYIPELIFGNLLTSSNYNDTDQRIVGGVNGYGSKVANIYSKSFTVETVDNDVKLKYKQIFKNNMFDKGKPKISDSDENAYTKITFEPDFKRFGIKFLTEDIISLMKRRAFDTTATTNSRVSVYFNGTRIQAKEFQSYIKLYKEIEGAVIYDKVVQGEFIWEYAVSLSENFNQVSFVNGIATSLGGRHLDYVCNQIIKKLSDLIESKKKINVKPSYIKERLFLFVRATVVNPSFSNQSKDTLTTPVKDLGIKFEVSETFMTKLYKSGIVEDIISFTNYKNQKVLEKVTDGKKKNKISVPKLEDANFAGTAKSNLCKLILTEGDSAKTFAISGLSVIGRDRYGVFPLRGKLLNIREATQSQLTCNAEIINIKKILGLQQNKVYTDTSSLRYGGIIILTDADSVTYDTPVLLKDNTTGEIITKPICEAYDYEDWAIEPFSGKEYNSCSKYKIWSDNGWTDIKHVMRHLVDKPIYRVNTSKGCVDVTKDHSLLDSTGKSITVDDCTIGETELLHSQYKQEKVFDYGINEEYAYALGYFMADGGCYTDSKTTFLKQDGTYSVNNRWSITCTSHITLIILKKIFEKYEKDKDLKFIIRKTIRAPGNTSFSNKNYIYSLECKGNRKDFCYRYRKMFYNSLREKQIPKEILNSSINIQKEFLEGFYEGDGNKSVVGNKTRHFDMQHKTSILGMFQILQNCGYSPTINCSEKKLNVYKILMSKTNCRPVHTVKKIIDVSEKYRNTYVYDFETENHHFHASTGNTVVKNCDGIHIQGLIMNFIHTWWPELLEIKGFITKMKTPIIKVTKKKESKEFYTLQDFHTWEKSISNNTWETKYYKGLGTSTAAEAKSLFSRIDANTVNYTSNGLKETENSILLAFEKKQADNRKVWLGTYNNDLILDQADQDVSYTDFIHKDLIHFSMYDTIRSIPSICDGLKPSQRKILYTIFNKNYKKEIKVAQFGAAVAEFSSYHHGEASLFGAIINMAQNYIGSNNWNLLKPNGQFGTRLLGGADAASPRYIFTELSEIAEKLFLKEDLAILKDQFDDGNKIEPAFYVPVLPVILINGTSGIGTGYSTNVPSFNPDDIISNMIKVIKGEEQVEMVPWYSNFKGTIKKIDEDSFLMSGIYDRLGDKSIKITELPVGLWTNDYKEYLEKLSEDPKLGIHSIINNSSETEIDFEIKFNSRETRRSFFEKDAEKVLKMNKSLSSRNMHLFDENGAIKKYKSAEDILEEFVGIRLKYNELRKANLLKTYNEELDLISNKMRFLTEIMNEEFLIYKRPKKAITDELEFKKYSKVNSNFDYLTSLPIYSFTSEKIEDLQNKKDKISEKIKNLEGKTPISLLAEDIKNIKVNI
jgi:DNA gyrase/topoisomerase IV subunit B